VTRGGSVLAQATLANPRPAARRPARTLAAFSSVNAALPRLPSSALPSHAQDAARDGPGFTNVP